jgi:hypothetical protein
MSFIDDYNKRTRDNMYDSPTRSPYAKNLGEYTADIATPPASDKSGGFNAPVHSPPVNYGRAPVSLADLKQKKIFVLGVMSWLLLGVLTGIPALIIAARNRPLATRGKIGVGLAIFSTVVQAVAIAVFVKMKLSGAW